MTCSHYPPMPSDLDGVIAAPGCHLVIYEEGGIRVLEVTVEAGTKEPVHTHDYPAILMAQTDAHLLYELFEWGEGAWKVTSAEERYPRAGGARWIQSEPAHALTSLDDHTFKAIRVEFLDGRLADLATALRVVEDSTGVEPSPAQDV